MMVDGRPYLEMHCIIHSMTQATTPAGFEAQALEQAQTRPILHMAEKE
jgi:hypothetical protein